MASEIRVNQIQSRTGVSTISFTETGPIISGVTTVIGDLDVTGLISYDDVTNIDSVGVVTARDGIHVTGGSVGIGTDNPSASLDVLADAASGYIAEFRQAHASNTAQIIIDSPTDGASRPSYMDYATGGTVKWRTGLGYLDANRSFHIGTGSIPTNSKLTITPDGNVGINETNPGRRLHINSGATDTALKLESTDAEVSLELADNAGSSYIGGGGNYLNFYSGGNERLRIESGGFVGLGTNNPYHELHIQGSGDTRALITSGGTGDAVMMFENASGNTWGHGIDLTNNNYVVAYNSTSDPSLTADGILNVDTSGNLLLGQEHTTASDLAGGFTKRLAVEGTSAANSSIGLTRNANDDNPPYIYFGKSRGTSTGSNTRALNGDTIGMVNFAGSRGTGAFGDAVNLRAYAEDNFSGSSSPGRFSVWTTPANTTSPQESFQVNSDGAITAPRNVCWSYRRVNNGASWGSTSSATYPNLQYRTPLPLFGASSTDYDTHNGLSTFTSGSGTGIKYTVPVGGKYLVMLNMSSVKNHTELDWGSIGLMVNTTAQASTGALDYMLDTMYYPDSTSSNNQLGWGGSVIIHVSANDYIVPYTMSVEKFSSDNRFYFQGYLLG